MTITIEGQPLTKLPEDLYIPPEALEIILETFEGPLDLLLYLIRKQNLDILNIPIAKITQQYLEYINLMQIIKFELAAEYLLMAAILAEIKSRMLLPKPPSEEGEEECDDPRAELIRRLQEYEQFKTAAEKLDELPRLDRDNYIAIADLPDLNIARPLPAVSFDDLMQALKDILVRADNNAHHHIQKEPLSIRQRMTDVLARLNSQNFTQFTQLFSKAEGKLGVVVTFIAILELVKQSMIELIQREPYSPIYVKTIEQEL